MDVEIEWADMAGGFYMYAGFGCGVESGVIGDSDDVGGRHLLDAGCRSGAPGGIYRAVER